MEIISFNNLSIQIGGQTIVEKASFNFTSSSRCALIGINGSGKSTLMRVLSDYKTGDVFHDGTISKKKNSVIEYVAQLPSEELLSKIVVDVIIEHMNLIRPAFEDWKAYVVMSDIGIKDEVWNLKLSDLSGGEVNKVMLARSLAVEPDLFF